MKKRRFLGPTIIAALLLTAAFGANSAGATALCDESAKVCPGDGVYPAGTTLKAKLASGTTFHINGTVETKCTESTLEAKANSGYGEPVSVSVTGLTLGGCAPACASVEAVGTPYEATISHASKDDGTLSIKNFSLQEKDCTIFKITCTVNAAELNFDLVGGSSPKLVASSEPISREGFGCGNSGYLSATYEVTSPTPLFVSPDAAGTLCEVNEDPCSAGNAYPAETSFEGELVGLASFDSSYLWSCSEGTIGGEILGEGTAEITSLSFNACDACPAEAKAVPFATETIPTGGGDGRLTVKSPSLWLEDCTVFDLDCVWSATQMTVDFEGGTPGRLSIDALMNVSGHGCGSTGILQAEFEITDPESIYLTPGT